ncbi:precorrin-8X methylmutase [Phytohalomonas tamaricis]|uniref:precorrin-8X methylmutase n=1 Tax=Phytohalomonas tamaricis TaxID=2081032 RepID=UPI0021D40C52|nr:precorrin-8X methylmutase [Phytohalomonas tamaricis]
MSSNEEQCAKLRFDYERDPLTIERESFRQIRTLTDLSRWSEDEQQIAMRLVHTCGDPAIVDGLRLSDAAVARGLDALTQGGAILCDVEMVRHGLTRRLLAPLTSQSHCFLNDERTPVLARERGETRSMAALELWRPHLDHAVVLIGNAPTALFRLLEMIDAGAPRPALVIGMPVGFVGAAESKDALWQHHRALGIECMTLLGRQGGSALTAATFNALLRLHAGMRL